VYFLDGNGVKGPLPQVPAGNPRTGSLPPPLSTPAAAKRRPGVGDHGSQRPTRHAEPPFSDSGTRPASSFRPRSSSRFQGEVLQPGRPARMARHGHSRTSWPRVKRGSALWEGSRRHRHDEPASMAWRIVFCVEFARRQIVRRAGSVSDRREVPPVADAPGSPKENYAPASTGSTAAIGSGGVSSGSSSGSAKPRRSKGTTRR